MGVRRFHAIAHTGYAWACSPACAGVLPALLSLVHCSLHIAQYYRYSSALLYGLLYSQALGTPSWLCQVRPGVAVVIAIVVDHPLDVPLGPAHLLFFLAFPFPFEPALHPKARAKAKGLALKGDL